jgi:prevent-host-death family protein
MLKIGIKEFRKNISKYLTEAQKTPIVITKRGETIAYIISKDVDGAMAQFIKEAENEQSKNSSEMPTPPNKNEVTN